MEKVSEYVVQLEEGADGITGVFEVRAVWEGDSEPISWLTTYEAAAKAARQLNRDELGITVFPGPKQAWLFTHWPE